MRFLNYVAMVTKIKQMKKKYRVLITYLFVLFFVKTLQTIKAHLICWRVMATEWQKLFCCFSLKLN